MDRCPVPRGISKILKLLAVAGLTVNIYEGRVAASHTGAVGWSGGPIIGIIGAVALWTYAELIAVVLAIEENTRNTFYAVSSGSRP
jgi:hypothetical protein